MKYEEYIREGLPSRREIEVFIHELSWARFDPVTGYILGNYIPHDGIDNSSTISTAQPDRSRTSFLYAGKPCRINTYGNSFTQCHQVSDGETWQEYLAAHLGEPVRNFGMGGYGLYQSYRRMLQEENTSRAADYIILYLWGDDHIRSLLRCRYMLTQGWMREREQREEVGRMFHGNFWCNIEMDLKEGKLVEKENRITNAEDLFKMNDPAWMTENLRDDLALQMALFERKKIDDPDHSSLMKLAECLEIKANFRKTGKLQATVRMILDQYSFAATRYILEKAKEYTDMNHKKLMIVLFDPYKVTRSLIGHKPRYDQEIVDYLQRKNFNYFDMNLVHAADFKNFRLKPEEYFKRYFIGHYSPAGNHFFAFSIKPKIVDWLDPRPITYRPTNQQFIDFKGYLEGIE